jgi:hypothetical protein
MDLPRKRLPTYVHTYFLNGGPFTSHYQPHKQLVKNQFTSLAIELFRFLFNVKVAGSNPARKTEKAVQVKVFGLVRGF